MDGQPAGKVKNMATVEQKVKRIKKRADAGAIVIKGAMRDAAELAEEAGASPARKADLATKRQAVIDAINNWCQSAKDGASEGGVAVPQSGGGDKDDE